ncbi:MAG: ABC transporter ATP-binding protein [Lewinellaceae bacterium]|nr:ABC transporter ATP-binding protein [Saprospiraceae bacterium]MCB9331502.1 ABC transporter ATP-binding protein [Lewinellaceae bacterium]
MAQAKKKIPVSEQFSSLRNVPRFFRMIWQVSPALTLWNVVLRLVQSGVPLAMLYVGKEIIDLIVAAIDHPAGAVPISSPAHPVWIWVGAEFVLAIANSLLGRAITLTDSLLGDLVNNDSSVRIIRHAATLDLYQFEDATFYDKLERARTQTAGRTALMSMVLSQAQDIITVIFLSGGLIAFNPWLMVILVIAVIPSFVGETRFNRESYSLTRSWTPERRELDYLRFVGASNETAKEIKIFGLEGFIADRFKIISDKYFKANQKLALRRAAWGGFFSALGTASYYAAYVFIVVQTVLGAITLGTLTFLAGAFSRLQGLLQGMVNRFSRITEMALYLQDLFDFLELQPLSQSRTGQRKVPRPIREGFRFENVGFKYPESENWALRNLSFTLPPGEKLALVGENGAGKTTVVKLLANLYEPTEGRILLDGVDLREFDPEDLRREIGIIFQDYVRFMFTAGENIAVGNVGEWEDSERIETAAQKSLADTVVETLPKKYKQMLGRRFSGGVDLSGGQWQKVALARAYMRDAQLVILDEPTAALDARAEHEVFVRFAELMRGKAAVLISHRFSTVRMADRILFLEHGRLLELGSHEELLAKGGKYAELFRLQAKGYA